MIKKLKKITHIVRHLFQLGRRVDEIKINQGRILTGMQIPDGNLPLWGREFKVFSQWGEDGIIQYLVNNINIAHRNFIEFGVEDFSESNCRFLMMKDQWHGFVIDGSADNIERLRESYYYWQYRIIGKAAFITRDNIAQLLDESGFEKDLGLLSVDLDGIDYHVLEALHDWRPAILVVEYNDAFGWQRPVSVPYDASFVRRQKHFSNQYWGANLPAFCYLAGKRGYALVGTNSVGSNAFFVRRELLNDAVREVELVKCVREATFRDSRDEAALLKKSGHHVVVVASGRQLDPNRPSHFAHLTERISAVGVTDQFRVLGLIPYEHVAPLMTGSVALLNPSLFEGWSTTVEEARALQVPMVLSDLPVHHEQASGMARFFDRTNARSLADALLAVWEDENPFPPVEEQAIPPLDPVQRFADDFVDLALRVVDQYRYSSKAAV